MSKLIALYLPDVHRQQGTNKISLKPGQIKKCVAFEWYMQLCEPKAMPLAFIVFAMYSIRRSQCKEASWLGKALWVIPPEPKTLHSVLLDSAEPVISLIGSDNFGMLQQTHTLHGASWVTEHLVCWAYTCREFLLSVLTSMMFSLTSMGMGIATRLTIATIFFKVFQCSGFDSCASCKSISVACPPCAAVNLYSPHFTKWNFLN